MTVTVLDPDASRIMGVAARVQGERARVPVASEPLARARTYLPGASVGDGLKRFLPGGLRRALGRLRARMRERSVRRLRKMGVSFARRDDLYSPLPTVEDLRRTERRWNRPSDLVGVRVDRSDVPVTVSLVESDQIDEVRVG